MDYQEAFCSRCGISDSIHLKKQQEELQMVYLLQCRKWCMGLSLEGWTKGVEIRVIQEEFL